jgi:hypothetical protein
MRLDAMAEYLSVEVARRRLNLFTGAGFSSDATDHCGRRIPTGPELADEVWPLCFDDEERDPDSNLEDLFHVALVCARERLEHLLASRLTVLPDSLPEWYELWFAFGWRRAYTVNIDDIECAIARRFELPRPIRTISALGPHGYCGAEAPSDVLEVVHLNGVVAAGPKQVTFSTTQYGTRLAHEDDCYRRLASDLERYPFVLVGTKLAESPLWQHLDGRAVSDRPRSFLVTRSISRARQRLLEDMNIEWIAQSAAEFARTVLGPIGDSAIRKKTNA